MNRSQLYDIADNCYHYVANDDYPMSEHYRYKLLMLMALFICFKHIAYGQEQSKHQEDAPLEMIQKCLEEYDTLSPYSIDMRVIERIDSLRYQITHSLTRFMKNDSTPLTDWDKHLHAQALMITYSADRNIWIFSLDEKTGGTYRPYTTIIYYVIHPHKAQAEIWSDRDFDAYDECSFDTVFVVDEEQKVYLALGSLYTCTTCLWKGAMLYKIASNGLSYEPLFTFEGRYAQLKRFEYLSASKEFVYEYEEADSADPLYGPSDKPKTQDGIIVYRGRFRYAGGRFKKIEHTERKTKR